MSNSANLSLSKGRSKSKLGVDFDSLVALIDRLLGGQTVVTFSATPTFDASLGRLFKIVLTANVTSFSITNPAHIGQVIVIKFVQDATGGRTVAFPAGIVAEDVVAKASSTSIYAFQWDGVSWLPASSRLSDIMPAAQQTVTFSATPAFDASAAKIFDITLTGNVTSSTVTNPLFKGQKIILRITQDGTGSRTFAFPANFKGATAISGTAGKVNTQEFTWDGSSWFAVAAGTNY